MAAFSARNRLVLWLLAAGIGLALFFTGEYRDLDLPLGWIGTVLFVAATWFSVDALYRVPQSEEEAAVAPGEWQAGCRSTASSHRRACWAKARIPAKSASAWPREATTRTWTRW